MRRACREVEALIDRRAGGLADAERLVLEQHLAECASCRQLTHVMREVVELMREAPARLGESARERAIANAFENLEASPRRAEPRRLGRQLAVGLLAAAALVLFVRLSWSESANPEQLATSREVRVPTSASVRELPPVVAVSAPSGATEGRSGAASEPAPGAPDIRQASAGWVDATRREIRAFAHARVELEPGARLRFREESSTLELARGRVRIEVEPSAKRRFAVLTQNFRVQVLGTQFTVSAERVDVQRGRVQVFDRRGRVLARELAAGASFTYRAPERAQPAKHAVATPESSERVSAAQALAEARARLAEGNIEETRELLAEVERAHPSRRDRAEAGTLRAECALLERDASEAVRLYRGVAERFAELPAGENAAFAAAQLAARASGEASAREHFVRYLARYPDGRFASEARARLARDAK